MGKLYVKPIKSERRILPLAAFIALFCVGIAILALSEQQHALKEAEIQSQSHGNASDWGIVGITLLQHLASALIVASIMGVSYEYFVHKHVVKGFSRLLEENRKVTEQSLDAFRATTAREVFEFIGNVASHSSRMPTLFKPPRDSANEVLFSTDVKFFQRLIGSANASAEAVEVLDDWLESTQIQKRFLASDFVGLLLLSELEVRLRELAAEHQKNWKLLTEVERGCVLNYWWAVSRLETPMYETLKEYLVKSEDPFVRKWILFVPCQMPDLRFAHVVELFLRTRGGEVQKDVLAAAIDALEALHHSGIDMKHAVVRYREIFEKASLWAEACAAVSVVLPPSVKTKRNRIGRAFRFLRRSPPQS